jgi:hypothetical protein
MCQCTLNKSLAQAEISRTLLLCSLYCFDQSNLVIILLLVKECLLVVLPVKQLFSTILALVEQLSSEKAVNMMTRGATSFTKAIVLVLLTSACPSFQDSNYAPNDFSNWNELRSCAQYCLHGGDLNPLGCTLNNCYCRPDIIPQAVSLVSACASTSCSNTNDVVSATSFYQAYCASATNTAVISLISNTPPVAVPGSTVTGTTSMLLLTKTFFPPLSSLFLMILNEDHICLQSLLCYPSRDNYHHPLERPDYRCRLYHLPIWEQR